MQKKREASRSARIDPRIIPLWIKVSRKLSAREQWIQISGKSSRWLSKNIPAHRLPSLLVPSFPPITSDTSACYQSQIRRPSGWIRQEIGAQFTRRMKQCFAHKGSYCGNRAASKKRDRGAGRDRERRKKIERYRESVSAHENPMQARLVCSLSHLPWEF